VHDERLTSVSGSDGLRSGHGAVALGTRSGVMVLLVVAVALAGAAALFVLPTGSAELWVLAAPAFVAVSYFVLQGPKWCIAGIIGSVVFGLSNSSLAAGGLDLRVTDLFYVLLAVWVVVLRARDGQRGYLAGRPLLGVWLLVAGFSLYPLFVQGTGTQEAVVSWLRLVATFSLVWLVPYAVRTVRDLEFTLGALALAVTVQVGASSAVNIAQGKLEGRLSGANGPNSTGMLAVLLIVLALHGPVPRHRSLRWTMLIVGTVGLLMTRSLASTAAAVVVLGFYGLRGVYRAGDRSKTGLLVPSRILLMLAVGLVVATVLRPSNLPGAEDFGHSTTVNRLILADAGLRLFAEHPLTGIGWHNTPFEIGKPELTQALRETWGEDVNQNFFPSGAEGASAHNTYVQILAESGLVGLVAFLAAALSIGFGLVRVLRTVRQQRTLYLCMRVTLVMIVAIMLWLNDNPLFGAQPETVLLALFLGLFAAAPAILRGMPHDEALSESR
jgi:O-antigen ligase